MRRCRSDERSARSLTGAKKKELVGDFKTTAGNAARKAISRKCVCMIS
jgi:hypothetical protein